MSKILGPDGRPIKTDTLRHEIAAPTLSGPRNPWHDNVAGGLTPIKLADMLKAAAEGDAHDYLTLAEQMEEADLHYASVLATRKRAIGGVDMTVRPASDKPADVKIAQAVRTLIENPRFADMRDDLLDGLAKGYAAVEIIWPESRGDMWTPTDYCYRDPQFFMFDKTTGHKLRLVDENETDGLALPPYKFITHTPRLKSGLPIRGGLARLVAMAFMSKAWTIKDWVAFLEVFGMPVRLGRYDDNASEDDRAILKRAVANIGTDAAGILPEHMRIEFVERSGGAGKGGPIYQSTAEWWDRQISKAVLGQTASTEGTPGKLGNESAQDDVRHDILRSDCRQLAATINRDLIRPFVDLNFGPQEAYPIFDLPVREPEDIAQLTDSLAKLIPLGLKVKAGEVRSKLGLAEPGDEDEVLGLAPKDNKAAQAMTRTELAMNAAAAPNAADEIEADALGEWRPMAEGLTQHATDAIGDASSYETAMATLSQTAGQADIRPSAKAIGTATFKARAAGDTGDDD
ncbi:MAG: DUF935 domain-containing protein [Pseudomonadota bacterium]